MRDNDQIHRPFQSLVNGGTTRKRTSLCEFCMTEGALQHDNVDRRASITGHDAMLLPILHPRNLSIS